MVKKLFFISVLLVVILYGILYLSADAKRAVAFSVDNDIKPIIILRDDHFVISEGETFYPESLISVYHPETCILAVDKNYDTSKIGSYTIDILVTCGGDEATATMLLEVASKEVEIVTVEKVVTEYITIPSDDEGSSSAAIEEETAPYLYGHHDISLPRGSSVATLIQALSTDVVTNVQVTIDYAEVDLSYPGTYKAYYYTEIGQYTVLVTIY